MVSAAILYHKQLITRFSGGYSEAVLPWLLVNFSLAAPLFLLAPPLVCFRPGFCIFAAKSLCCAISFVTVKHDIVHSFVYSASKLMNFLLYQLSCFTRMRKIPAAESPAVLTDSIWCDPDSAHRAGLASLCLFPRADPLGTALRRVFP